MIDPVDPISTIQFLHDFKMAHDSKGIRDKAAIKLLPCFMRKSATAAFMAHSSIKSKCLHYSTEESKVDACLQVMSHVLETQEMNDIIAEKCSKLLQMLSLGICCHWNFPMSCGSGHLNGLSSTCMYSREYLSRDHGRSLCTVCKHT